MSFTLQPTRKAMAIAAVAFATGLAGGGDTADSSTANAAAQSADRPNGSSRQDARQVQLPAGEAPASEAA